MGRIETCNEADGHQPIKHDSKPRILVVDDEPELIETLRDILVFKGFDVETAENGAQAIGLLRGTHHFDLLITDLRMPGMGGKEFLRRIKADDDLCTIPVVVVTTSELETDIQESYKLHAAGYVQKIANVAELQDIIRKLAKYWFSTVSLVKS